MNAWYGGTEYRHARYLRAYTSDTNQPSEAINTYVVNDDGSVVSKVKARLQEGYSANSTDRGQDLIEGTFYAEKLSNTPLYNYVKLIVAEYNSILFRNPPQRDLPDTSEVEQFVRDVDGEGNSISEFMALVDMYTTIFGVCHVGCYKPIGSDIPKWRIHTPMDVTNWSYKYDIDGNLKLSSIVIKVEENDSEVIYRHITPTTMETVFVGAEEDDYVPSIDDARLEDLGDGVFRVTQENELGYIPVKTIYQSTKVYNNIGTTIISDVAQIQRSIYGDMAEIYSAIAYGSHPTLVVDETTDQLNDGQIGAEPGAVIRVQNAITGESAFTYEFVAPKLDAISEIRELVDSKIDKLTQIAMLRSESLIRAANSGEQLEVYDDKLASLIRRKATNLENAEYGLWKIWADWLNINIGDDFHISYSRHYNKRALSHEISEISGLMSVYEKYKSMFGAGSVPVEEYATADEAEARAESLGGSGFHSHTRDDGTTVFMPFNTHQQYEAAVGVDVDDDDYEEDLRDKLRQRIEELLGSSSTSNSL